MLANPPKKGRVEVLRAVEYPKFGKVTTLNMQTELTQDTQKTPHIGEKMQKSKRCMHFKIGVPLK